MIIYDITREERKTAELTVINSTVQKRAQNREKSTNGDYFIITCVTSLRFPYNITYEDHSCISIEKSKMGNTGHPKLGSNAWKLSEVVKRDSR